MPSLVTILLLFVVAEIALHRLLLPWVLSGTITGLVPKYLEPSAIFLFYFIGLLALGLLVVANWKLVRKRRDTASWLHYITSNALPVIALFFLAVSLISFASFSFSSGLTALPIATVTSIALCLTYIALMFAINTLPNATLRIKIGFCLLHLPPLLQLLSLMTQQIPQLLWILPTGQFSDLPVQLYNISESLVVVGAFAIYLYYIPFARWRIWISPIPLSITVLIIGGLTVGIAYQYRMVGQGVYYTLGLTLPTLSRQGLFYLIAGFVAVLSISYLLFQPPPRRQTAIGLMLLMSSGLQHGLVYRLVALVGSYILLQAARDLVTEAPEAPIEAS